jgi:putative peptidoglycan lipid II flippase
MLNILGAIVALLNSVVTAYLFGTRREMEVFFAAATMLALVGTLTQTGQLAEAFLPMYHRIRHGLGQQAARTAFSVVLTWMLIGTVVLSMLLAVASPLLIRLLIPGFAQHDRMVATRMFCALLPLVRGAAATDCR